MPEALAVASISKVGGAAAAEDAGALLAADATVEAVDELDGDDEPAAVELGAPVLFEHPPSTSADAATTTRIGCLALCIQVLQQDI